MFILLVFELERFYCNFKDRVESDILWCVLYRLSNVFILTLQVNTGYSLSFNKWKVVISHYTLNYIQTILRLSTE